MGGSVEDKLMYEGAGLLRKGPRFYALDSTDPAKLIAILADMRRRSGGSLVQALRSTLVTGMALGMTSFEPVLNLEKLVALYERHGLDPDPHFIYLTIPGSLLDNFGTERSLRSLPVQMDGANTIAGRHSGPLSRGALYPLAFAGGDLRTWIAATSLSKNETDVAWKVAAFVHEHGIAGRDKVNLLLPDSWESAGWWTKQDFEESLGKSEHLGLKIVLGDYQAASDRMCLAVAFDRDAVDRRFAALRRAGVPAARVVFPKRTPLSHYMQFVHTVVFGIATLREMDFSTQPSVELYKQIAGEIYKDGRKLRGVTRTTQWKAMIEAPQRAVWKRGLTLYYDGLGIEAMPGDAPSVYAALLHRTSITCACEYGEITFFGDLRYDEHGRRMRRTLKQAADRLFRTRGRPVDVNEGPAMNHSYHEMIIGHGKCFSTILMPRRHRTIDRIGYDAEYHVAQFLATKLALGRRQRPAVAILIDDMRESSLEAVAEFFRAAAAQLTALERAA